MRDSLAAFRPFSEDPGARLRQVGFPLDVYLVPGLVLVGGVHPVPDLAFQGNVRDQALGGLGVHSGQVAGVGVAVGVAVLDVEEQHEIVPAFNIGMGLRCRGHW